MKKVIEMPIKIIDCMIFNHVKRRRERLKRMLHNIINGDIRLNNIPETLFFNCVK